MPCRSLLITLLALAAWLGPPAAPVAAEPPSPAPRFLVLVIAGQEQHQGLADNAVEILIARLAQDGREPIGPEGLLRDYPDRSALRRCAVDIECVSRAAGTLGADGVLLGLLSGQGDGVTVTLEAIDAVARRSLARTTARVAERELATRLLELTGGLLAELRTTPGRRAALELRLRGARAQRILLDGAPVGSGDQYSGADLDPGDHELVLEFAGGDPPVRRHLVLEPGRRELTIGCGTEAEPWERHLQEAEQALFEGDAERALSEAEAALAAPDGEQPEVLLLLARVCLRRLDRGPSRPELVARAFDAVRRAIDLRGGGSALRLQAELLRRFARVRIEPGPGWRQAGALRLEPLASAAGQPPVELARALAGWVGGQTWSLPAELGLPRPGHYRVNGRELLLDPTPEGRPLVLAVPAAPVQAPGDALPLLSLSLLGALGADGLQQIFGGLALTALPLCRGAWCLGGRLEADARLRSSDSPSESQRTWLRAGPDLAIYPLAPRLRLDVSADGLYAPGDGFGVAFGGGVGWLLLQHLRVGLRPSWNLFGGQLRGSTLGVQLELAGEL